MINSISTAANPPSDLLLGMGYNYARHNSHFKGTPTEDFILARRDYLIENLFASPEISADFDDEEEYSIVVATGLGKTFIYLDRRSSDNPDRMSIDKDGEVYVSYSGGDMEIFTPMANHHTSSWEFHDDEALLAGAVKMQKDSIYKIGSSSYPWYHCVCIPHVTKYQPGASTMALIIDKLNLK